MFALFNMYRTAITAGLIVALILGLYFYIHSLKTQILNLQSNLKDSQIELANYKLESSRLKSALTEQNQKITLLKVEKQSAVKALEEWEAKPPKIKYKTITKVREVKSDECKDIKKQLDAIRHINFRSL